MRSNVGASIRVHLVFFGNLRLSKQADLTDATITVDKSMMTGVSVCDPIHLMLVTMVGR
jgi:hypothetical protein